MCALKILLDDFCHLPVGGILRNAAGRLLDRLRHHQILAEYQMANMSAPLAALLALLVAVPAGAVTQENFLARDTEDIVAMCSATEVDPLFTAAVNFCQGYLVGAFQYHEAVAQATGVRKICLPEPRPSRDEAIRRFVAWARQNPLTWREPAVDAMLRFVVSQWACPTG